MLTILVQAVAGEIAEGIRCGVVFKATLLADSLHPLIRHGLSDRVYRHLKASNGPLALTEERYVLKLVLDAYSHLACIWRYFQSQKSKKVVVQTLHFKSSVLGEDCQQKEVWAE